MNAADAMLSVFATLTNVGPGLGIISQSFSQVPDNAKYVFSFAMAAGRLEIFFLFTFVYSDFLEIIMKTLILYLSREGQTKKIAEYIGTKF